MRRAIAVFLGLMLLSGGALAGEMTSGMEIKGGPNAFANLELKRADGVQEEEGILRLHMTVAQTENLRGYGFVLHYDAARYEFVEAKEIDGGLLHTGSGQKPLFVSANRSQGQVAVGAMKVDGEAANGDGKLVEFTFKTAEAPLPADFRIAEGVLVDLDGNIDEVLNVEIGNLKPMPERFGVSQNAPNPFNPTTTISYQLPDPAHVRMDIYNLLGQRVRTLIDTPMEAGYFSVEWDGKDQVGRQVATGIYLYRLQAGDFSQTLRMMLLK